MNDKFQCTNQDFKLLGKIIIDNVKNIKHQDEIVLAKGYERNIELFKVIFFTRLNVFFYQLHDTMKKYI